MNPRTWTNVGSLSDNKPFDPNSKGKLSNDQLSSALQSKTTFTEKEWNEFGINEVNSKSFIKSGDSYFQPAVPLSRQANQVEENTCAHWPLIDDMLPCDPAHPEVSLSRSDEAGTSP